jgi:hypothetical protein
MSTCTWGGLSFSIYTPPISWNDVGGIYIFSQLMPSGWIPYYIGQTNSFSARLPTHERWPDAIRRGATHVHALVVRGQADRERLERELIGAYQPPLNDHHR